MAQTFCDKDENRLKVKKELSKIYQHANDINVNLLWESLPDKESLKDLKYRYEYLPCAYLWSRILVYWDGLVTTCCRDYSGKNMKLGDSNVQSIKDLWKLSFEKDLNNIAICDVVKYQSPSISEAKNPVGVLGFPEGPNLTLLKSIPLNFG